MQSVYSAAPERSEYGIKQSDGEAPVMLKLLGNVEYPFIVITLSSIMNRRGTIYQPPPLGQDMTHGQFLSGV